MSVLIDTDVVIDHLRGVAEAMECLLGIVDSDEIPALSVVTVAEIEAGVREEERAAVESLLGSFTLLEVDAPIALLAGGLRRIYGPTHGVLLPDAIIAATAVVHGRTLYTLNRKHYPMPEVDVTVPYREPPG
jgi:hypothetical protein